MKFNLEKELIGRKFVYTTGASELQEVVSNENIVLGFRSEPDMPAGLIITADKIKVITDEEGFVTDEYVLSAKDNFAKLTGLAEKTGAEIWVNAPSTLKAVLFIAANFTDSWSVSPYSFSVYSSKDIDWGYKPEGSLRVSDHWNFGENGEHCPTAEPVEGWAVCKFENGVYHLVEKF